MRSIDEQVEAALDDVPELAAQSVYRQRMRDLLAGKFAEERLPEILPSPTPFNSPKVIQSTYTKGAYFVEANAGGVLMRGPTQTGKREAILAWNAGMRGEKL